MIALRDAYVTRFAALEYGSPPRPYLRSCEARDEDFTIEEIKRTATKATPSCYVIHTGLLNPHDEQGATAAHLFAAVVLADRGAGQREEKASPGDLAGVIAHRIAYELAFGDAVAGEVERPERVKAANLSSTRLALAGYAGWLVTWSVRADITPTDAEFELLDLERIHTDWDYAGGTPPGPDGETDSSVLVDDLQDPAPEEEDP